MHTKMPAGPDSGEFNPGFFCLRVIFPRIGTALAAHWYLVEPKIVLGILSCCTNIQPGSISTDLSLVYLSNGREEATNSLQAGLGPQAFVTSAVEGLGPWLACPRTSLVGQQQQAVQPLLWIAHRSIKNWAHSKGMPACFCPECTRPSLSRRRAAAWTGCQQSL